MLTEYERVNSLKRRTIVEYENFIKLNGFITEESLFGVTTPVLVGYFLVLHSKDPKGALRRFVKDHPISYRKYSEVEMLIDVLN